MAAYLTHQGKPVHDVHWAAKMFMVSAEQIQAKYMFAAWSTSAHNKFTDTRIGGNWAINNPPAYTRFADPRQSSINHRDVSATKPTGMGAFYSEQLDDNAHLVHMCFGVANFRGMLSFFNGMGNIQAAMYARLGRVPLSFLLGKAAGIYVGLRLLPLLLVGMAAKFLLNRGSSKYYSLKPTMHSYWKRVDFIANSFAVNTGLYQKHNYLDWGNKDQEAALDPSGTSRHGYTESEHSQLVAQAYAAAPEIFRKRGGIDVYALATRTQHLANARRKLLDDYASKISSKEDIMKMMIELEYSRDFSAKTQTMEEMLDLAHNPVTKAGSYGNMGPLGVGNPDFTEDSFDAGALVKDSITSADSMVIQDKVETDAAVQAGTNTDGTVTPEVRQSQGITEAMSMYNSWHQDPNEPGNPDAVIMKEGWMSKLWRFLSDNYHGAYEWVSFNVQHTGAMSVSFSNSSREADISSMINGFSSSMASQRFTFSNGATGIPGFDAAIGAVKNTILGFAAGIDAAGILSLAGSAYVDIPEHWDSSSTSFPSEQYKMKLRSVYANKLSRFIALYVPLSMIIAGALPISTGRQQYTSPYYCQVISPGRTSCKLGMIDNLSIEIGVGNMGYNQQNQPLGFDVSWTVKDMNKTMHAPIDIGGGLLNPAKGIFDDDNAFNDLLNVMSAVSMADQINPVRRLSKNIALRLNQWDSFWSIGNMTMGFYDSMLGRGVKTAVTMAGLAGVPGTVIPQLNRSLVQ